MGGHLNALMLLGIGGVQKWSYYSLPVFPKPARSRMGLGYLPAEWKAMLQAALLHPEQRRSGSHQITSCLSESTPVSPALSG